MSSNNNNNNKDINIYLNSVHALIRNRTRAICIKGISVAIYIDMGNNKKVGHFPYEGERTKEKIAIHWTKKTVKVISFI